MKTLCSNDPICFYRKMAKFMIVLILLFVQEDGQGYSISDPFVFTEKWPSL